ncbi:MAG: NapC/NirT family cytochrome c [Acidobacteria bacterium]|nr:NapC/NirT family cytochrome c [Acidobacteriota bacterium]
MADSTPNLRNWLSVAGAALAATSGALFLAVFLLDLFGFHTNPYIGILFFIVFPAFFALGLLLVPLGAVLERRRRRAGRPPSELHWPSIDLNDPRQRRTVFAVALLTIVNLLVVSLATYRGVEFMDSVTFCGQVCHEVMRPEFAAYQDSPHSRVTCVECHIGPGAPWFVRSKLSGTRQVFAVLMASHERPIPSPVEDLRPARDTCERCHWPEKFHGDKIKTIREYAADEKNTETVTTLRIHIGGGSERLGIAAGIHWHMNVANEIEYIALDEARQSIGYIWLRDRQGNIREYFAEDVTPGQLQGRERRRMDCMDCHNRPAHPFALSAERAVDSAIAIGEIAPTLPFAKREVVAAVKATYPDHTTAATGIAIRLRDFYRTQYQQIYASRRQDVERAIRAADELYRRNVFPEMRVGWGTYPNNIGHMAFPGCFRCHDGSHATRDGTVIRQECDLCHDFE